VIELARLRQILKIDTENRLAIVQPGVVNLHVSRAVARYGLYYVPDPSSQPTCTIGGNIAEGAGGIHCLKYGTTTDHVLGCKVVLAGGEIVELGGSGVEAEGYDVLGTFIGSEGTFGIATEATLRLVQTPPVVRTLLAEFGEVNNASHAVSAIIAAGVMPAALEMMDREIIRAVEASVFAAGLPPDAGAALLIELDGIEAGIDDVAERVTDICMEFGARSCRAARDEDERKKLWAARKGAFGAIGRISPDSMIQDAVVPRSRLPEVLSAAYEIAGKYELRIANVFHAGDGNLHPLICFDSRFPDQVKRVKEAGRELMQVCVAAGGTITGEHGVGLDKRELLPLIFSDSDMSAMLRVRAAFDPLGLCNPGKIIPMLRGCGEGRAVGETLTIEHPTNGSPVRVSPVITPRTRSSFKIDAAAQALGAIVGFDGVTAFPHVDLALTPGSLLVLPASTEEVVEIVKLAANERWTIAPAGNTRWLNKRYESKANLVVTTRRLNCIVEHEPADLIAIAEAGVTLSSFNEQLAVNGQWLPLDPPDDGWSTLGGVVAKGQGGNQQFGYGGPRGSVIGMRVVLGDGNVINVGGRVVKNVAGYDLSKLFTGSCGTLGLITRLNFKLRPRPNQEQTVVIVGEKYELIDTARSLMAAKLFPVGIELTSRSTANQLNINCAVDKDVLLVRFAGTRKGVGWQTKQTENNLAGKDLTATIICDDQELWQKFAAIPVVNPAGLAFRISVLPSKANELLRRLAAIDEECFRNAGWQLGVGDGRFRMIDHQNRYFRHWHFVRSCVAMLHGNVFVEQSPGDVEQTPVITTSLMERVKQQLDPSGTFAV
jgi:D-lactate dehydrogenase (cytochrome)